MDQRIRWLYALVVALFLAAPGLAVVEVPPPPPTHPSGSPPTGGNPGGGNPNPAPEPATVVSALVGAAAAGLYAWRRRAKQVD